MTHELTFPMQWNDADPSALQLSPRNRLKAVDDFEKIILSHPLMINFPLGHQSSPDFLSGSLHNNNLARDHDETCQADIIATLCVCLSVNGNQYENALSIPPTMSYADVHDTLWECVHALPLENKCKNEMYLTFHDGYDEFVFDDDHALSFLRARGHPRIVLTLKHIEPLQRSLTERPRETTTGDDSQQRGFVGRIGNTVNVKDQFSKVTTEINSSPSNADKEVNTVVPERETDKIICDYSSRMVPIRVSPISVHRGAVLGITFLQGQSLLATGASDGLIKLWDSQNGFEKLGTLRGHQGMVLSLQANPVTRDTLASGSEDRTVSIWSTSLNQRLFTLRKHARRVYCVKYDTRGERLISAGADGALEVWNPTNGEHIQSISPNEEGVEVQAEAMKKRKSHPLSPQLYTLCILPTHQNRVSCGNERGELFFIDWECISNIRTVNLHSESRLTNSEEWDLKGDKVSWKIQQKAIWAIEVAQYESYIVVGGNGPHIHVVDPRMAQPLVNTLSGSAESVIHALRRSERGSTLIHSTSRDEWLTLWDIRTSKVIERSQTSHNLGIYALESLSGLLAVAGIDGSYSVWSEE